MPPEGSKKPKVIYTSMPETSLLPVTICSKASARLLDQGKIRTPMGKAQKFTHLDHIRIFPIFLFLIHFLQKINGWITFYKKYSYR